MTALSGRGPLRRMPLTSSRWGRWVPFVLLTVALVVFPLVASTAVVNVGVYALIYGLAAIGLSLLMGLAGQVSLGHAAFFAVGAYTQALLVTKAGWSMWPAAIVATIAAMVVALLVGLPLLRLRGHFLALATLGLGIIVTVVVRELEITGGTSGIYGIPKPEFGGRLYNSAQEYFWLLSPFVVVGMLLATNLVRSRMGRALGAVNDSEVAAECLGVDTFALRLRVFVLAAGYAGLAGVFYAHWLGVVSPEAAGFELSVELLLMVVLGGLGTVWGALTGAIAVSVMDEGARDLITALIPGASGEVQLLAFGVVLVLVILLVPGGLAQLWRQLIGARTAHSTDEAARTAPSSEGDSSSAQLMTGSRLAGLLEGADLPEPGSPLLVVRDLTKRYGGVTALDRVDLDVAAGEIVALIGPNGAGKTTAFNMISGVLPPTSGTVTLRGREVQGERPHVAASLGATRTFQNLQVFSSATVLGNVKVARHLRSRAGILRGMAGLARREERSIDAAARGALDALGLSDHSDRPVADLPFGRQRQVEIARALALGPALVMLDEPMAGLSGPERTSLSALLREASLAGVAVLIVEHDVEAVLALADRVAVLDDGRLIAMGEPEEIRNDPAVIAAYLGVAAEDESLVRQAAARVEGEVRT
ncbi:MAG TPA: branched-chain amino acid ABC transporter ATP-binding protein/permease [Intrasporangium sp.]|uniref:branched-chain amino acid ABC transporter ATP-binding protein/permease n=1 Tax=Intrasporangium sp. TaxID=1925024 RepID=UPI002F951839